MDDLTSLTDYQLRDRERVLRRVRGIYSTSHKAQSVLPMIEADLDAVRAELQRRGATRRIVEGLHIEIDPRTSDKWLRNYSLSWIRGQLDLETSLRLNELVEQRLTEDGTSRLTRELLLQIHEHLSKQDRFAAWVLEQVRDEHTDLIARIERLEER